MASRLPDLSIASTAARRTPESGSSIASGRYMTASGNSARASTAALRTRGSPSHFAVVVRGTVVRESANFPSVSAAVCRPWSFARAQRPNQGLDDLRAAQLQQRLGGGRLDEGIIRVQSHGMPPDLQPRKHDKPTVVA